MSAGGLNLARRPFVNRRPVRRLAVLLWIAGGVLLVSNATLYWRYFSGEGKRGEILATLEADIGRERQAIERLEGELAGFDLEWQNGQVEFLNEKIEQRVFSWSALFDDLAEVLPDDTLLTRVSPSRAATSDRRRTRARRRTRERDGTVGLSLTGRARDGESLLTLVDTLFAHPRFRDPDLARETKVEDGSLGFTLRVAYLPAAHSPATTAAADAGATTAPEPAEGVPAEAVRQGPEAPAEEVEG